MKKFLIVLVGPTAVGKTKAAISVAQTLDAEIISADSRQFYHRLKIGTAAPTEDELKAVRHHFVGHLDLDDYYSASSFEHDVLQFLSTYHETNPVALMVGGSGLYVDAVCNGIDRLPDPDEDLRRQLKEELRTGGLPSLCERLKILDPAYYEVVDLQNPNRILRALEVCIQTGRPFSSLRTNSPQKRDFEIIRVGLNRPREELVRIIHDRVDRMISDGLVEETRGLLPFRGLNALNTVGYKEMFRYLDGGWTLEMAREKIKTNTRRYAKRQMTWFSRQKDTKWFHPDDLDSLTAFLAEKIGR